MSEEMWMYIVIAQVVLLVVIGLLSVAVYKTVKSFNKSSGPKCPKFFTYPD
jgi:hypothetical protein